MNRYRAKRFATEVKWPLNRIHWLRAILNYSPDMEEVSYTYMRRHVEEADFVQAMREAEEESTNSYIVGSEQHLIRFWRYRPWLEQGRLFQAIQPLRPTEAGPRTGSLRLRQHRTRSREQLLVIRVRDRIWAFK